MTYPCNTDEVHQVPQWRTHVHPVAHNLLNGVHVSTQDAKVWKEYVALFALSRTENSAKKSTVSFIIKVLLPAVTSFIILNIFIIRYIHYFDWRNMKTSENLLNPHAQPLLSTSSALQARLLTFWVVANSFFWYLYTLQIQVGGKNVVEVNQFSRLAGIQRIQKLHKLTIAVVLTNSFHGKVKCCEWSLCGRCFYVI